MIFTNSEGLKIYYRDSGEENLQTVIFLHSWGSSQVDFEYTFKNLDGYRKIIYDHRGFGKSDRPERNMSLRTLAEDLKELIEKLKIENPILVGYSMGACVLFKYIELFGDKNIKSLVICDMTPKIISDDTWDLGIVDGNYGQKEFMESIAMQFDNMLDAYIKLFTDIDPKLKGRNNKVLKKVINMELEKNSYYSITSMWFSMGYEDFRESVKKIKVPTALFFAKPGSLVNPKVVEYLEESIEDTYTRMFENSSHSFASSKPKKFKSELELFLKTLK